MAVFNLADEQAEKVHPSKEAGKWGEDSWGNPDPETKDLVDQDTLVMTIQSISNSCVAMFSFQHMPLYLILAVTLLQQLRLVGHEGQKTQNNNDLKKIENDFSHIKITKKAVQNDKTAS